jgi:murein DD-endopeptidase MepM/ murein hydrolase activator NlpD
MQSVTRSPRFSSGLGALAFLGVLLAGTRSASASRPWSARAPAIEPKPAHQLRNPATWPAEPAVPAPIDPTRFAEAFAHLCNAAPGSPTAALAPKILDAAGTAASDPFTIAALAYYGSKCNPAFHSEREHTYGLMAIEPSMYRAEGAPALPVEKEALAPKRLLDPENNLAVGAALLEMWQAKHKEIDDAFGGGPHRTGVAHMVWGDEVRSSGHEDLILTARRRMIMHYHGAPETPRRAPIGIDVVPPLEGTPRVATSGPGDERDGGARRHRGLDIAATLGEPVRAIADGHVIFAGVNLPGRSRTGPIPPEKIKRWAWRRLGVGGIYVCLEHQDVPKRIVTCYMHLSSYLVNDRQDVKAGETIAFVGRTGVKVSPPHLHFEVRVDDRFTNPVRTLGDAVIPPQATMTHQYVLRARRLKRLRA